MQRSILSIHSYNNSNYSEGAIRKMPDIHNG